MVLVCRMFKIPRYSGVDAHEFLAIRLMLLHIQNVTKFNGKTSGMVSSCKVKERSPLQHVSGNA